MLIGGAVSLFYLIDEKSFDFIQILLANKEAVAIYIFISGGITFCLCHMYEPAPDDPKVAVL